MSILISVCILCFIELVKFTNIVKKNNYLGKKCKKFTIIVNYRKKFIHYYSEKMLHPGKEIMMRIEALGLTQKDFSQKLGKRVSEINELIKGKRNITIAWEFILSDFFKTAPKYWIYKQIDYDYDQMQNEINLKKSFLQENIIHTRLSEEGGQDKALYGGEKFGNSLKDRCIEKEVNGGLYVHKDMKNIENNEKKGKFLKNDPKKIENNFYEEIFKNF